MTSEAAGRWIVGVSGASGVCYARSLLRHLSFLAEELHLVCSESAIRVLAEEEGIKLSAARLSLQAVVGEGGALGPAKVAVYQPRDIGARIASGSALMSGMVIAPCSMSTVAAIASGAGSNLLHRAADVTLKEGRRLVLVPRETPLSALHLENMLRLSRLGVRIVPAMPGFYHRPRSIEELVEMMTMKILDQMGYHRDLVQRWRSGGAEEE